MYHPIKRLSLIILVSVAASGLSPAFADSSPQQTILEALKNRVPELTEDQIAPSPVDGLYTVTIGFTVYHVSADGKYIVNGDVIELATGDKVGTEQLSAKRNALLSSVPETDMIVYPSSNASKATIRVFTDTTCPYCRKLHEALPALTDAGIDVRYLAFPRAGANSDTAKDMASVWCAEDPQTALDEAMSGQAIATASCDDPVADQFALGVSMQIQGTPAIILDNGDIISGFMPPDALIPRAIDATSH